MLYDCYPEVYNLRHAVSGDTTTRPYNVHQRDQNGQGWGLSTGLIARASAIRFPSCGVYWQRATDTPWGQRKSMRSKWISLRTAVCACCSFSIPCPCYVSTLHVFVVLPSFQLQKSLRISACTQKCSADKIHVISVPYRVGRYCPRYNLICRSELSSQTVCLIWVRNK